MKYLKIVIIFFILFSTSHAQYNQIRVGVMPFYDLDKSGTSGSRSQSVVSRLTETLFQYRFINLVERSMIKEMMKEAELGMSGIVNDATAVRLGKVHGLQLIITGTIEKGRISARAVHMETQKVISSASVISISNIEKLGEKIASGIEVFLARENLKSLRNDSPGIDLVFWIERTGSGGDKITSSSTGKLKIGNSVVFKFKVNRDGYLTIVDIQPGGDVVVLFPNDLHPSNKITSGKEYSIPSKDDGFEITVSEPAGRDTVVAYFTKQKVDWLDRKKLTGEGFWTVKKKQKFNMARGFKITATRLKRADWESRVIEIDVVK